MCMRLVWYAVPEMWFDVTTTFYIASNTVSNIIPNHTISPRHITPAPLAAHYSTLQYHIYIAPCIGHITHHSRTTSRIVPHFTYAPHNATCSMYSTPYFRSRRILATSHHITFYTTLHCIPHLTVITPNSTSHYHVSHNIPHHTLVLTTLFYIHHLSRITPPLLPRIAPCHSPLCLIPHRITFHIPCHSTHTNPYYTTTFHNPIPVWETNRICDPFCYVRLSFTYNLLCYSSVKPNKNGGEKVQLYSQNKVPEKVIPVCPNTNLFSVVAYLIVTLRAY